MSNPHDAIRRPGGARPPRTRSKDVAPACGEAGAERIGARVAQRLRPISGLFHAFIAATAPAEVPALPRTARVPDLPRPRPRPRIAPRRAEAAKHAVGPSRRLRLLRHSVPSDDPGSLP
ncbi:hypothetical protein ACFQGW_15465 [Xanthomonas theicola]|uniref:hypothetical protein n=1 Tax=Xanthomonas theicola TaxID=56464 RepID=UPI00361CB3A7